MGALKLPDSNEHKTTNSSTSKERGRSWFLLSAVKIVNGPSYDKDWPVKGARC